MRELKKVALFSKEYPPYVYGGAGVHVEYLSQALAKLIAVEVRCFGDQRIDGRQPDGPRLSAVGGDQTGHRSALRRRRRRHRPLAGDGQGPARCRSGSLPHLVHRHGRRAREPALGRALCAHDPLAGAAPALEGGAARRCLPSERLDGAHGDRAGRCRRRRLARDARRRAAPVRRQARARPRHPQRHRPGGISAGSGTRRAHPLWHRPQPSVSAFRRPHHPTEGHHSPRQRHPRDRPRTCRSCFAPARRTRPRSAGRWRKAWPGSPPAVQA